MFVNNFLILFLFLLTGVNATDQRTADAKGESNPALATHNNGETCEKFIERSLVTKFQVLENKIFDRIKDVIFMESAHQLQSAQLYQMNITSRLHALENKFQKIENQLGNISAILAEYSCRGSCDSKPDTSANTTTTITKPSQDNAKHESASPRLLNVTVPSSVRARPDAWKKHLIPEVDDLDQFMANTTGCEYMARSSIGGYQSVSTSTLRGGRWQRRLAVRGERNAHIRVTWGKDHDYRFWIGNQINTHTQVYDDIRSTYLLTRETPSLMSKERYSQFFYFQLEDGVMSFGALDDSTPWWRKNVMFSTEDIVKMEYKTLSAYGVKLLVCA